ncbi:MAG: aminotransferase [Pseudomonadota bacterium]
MTAAINPHLRSTLAPPVMEARRWLAETELPGDMPLLNLSQAAPVDPPPKALRTAMARALSEGTEAHLYGPVLGDGALRQEIAERWSEAYDAPIPSSAVAVTAGCNQAFCAAIASLAAPGEAVMLPVPWYFNHHMWLEMSGVRTVPLPCGEGMLPDPADAARRLTPDTRAIALVSPNNPTGAEYPPALLEGFFALARERGLALIVDETYRDFHSADGPPHGLFAAEGWPETLIHLYSFSKVFRLTGHRTGALISGDARIAQIEKFLDTVTICPPRTGQIGALEGLREMRQWVAGERAEVLARRAAVEATFAALPGWRLLGAGAYFAWVETPFDLPSAELARRLLVRTGILVLPGSMFCPAEGDWGGEAALRIAFANADSDGIAEMGRRLAGFTPF